MGLLFIGVQYFLFYKIISTNLGFYLFIIIPLMYIIGYEIINVLLKGREERMGF